MRIRKDTAAEEAVERKGRRRRARACAAGCLLALLLGSAEGAAQTSAGAAGPFSLSRAANLRYNRVEGFFGGYRVGMSPRGHPRLTATIDAGYGAQSRGFRWEVGLDYAGRRWGAGATLFDRTATSDQGIVSTGENTLFALLFKGDYRDYYRASSGFEARGHWVLKGDLRGVANVAVFTYGLLPVRTDWSIFRAGDSTRQNPAPRPGDAGILRAGLVYDTTRPKSPVFRNAWLLSLIYERGFREFPYDGAVLALKRYQKVIFGRQAFVLRTMAASRESLDEQHLFDIGGISTLQGYRIKEYSGNRMLLANVDYLFNGDLFGRIPLKGVRLLELILFADAGWVATAPRADRFLDGFGSFRLKDVRTDVGAALALYRQLVRVNLARRLDGDADDWTIQVRIRREL